MTRVKYILAICFIGIGLGLMARADDYTSTSFRVKDPVLDSGAQNSTSTSFGVGQSFTQSVIGKSTSTSFQLWAGFQYFFKADANTLTATAGDAQVVLSWTAPSTFLGVSVGAYEVGVGTTSGSYTFTSVGAVTSYTQTSLTNGTTYYFKIKAKTASGTFLVFSNEASATPSGSGQGGGGGGGYSPSAITFTGLAYPNSEVFLLKNASVAVSAQANSQGEFSMQLTGVSVGAYQFLIYAKDIRGVRSAFLPITGSVSAGQSPVIKDIFLPPTLSLDKVEVKKGESLTISGFAQKNARVSLLSSPAINTNLEAQAAADGAYSVGLDTSTLNFGNYALKARSLWSQFISIYSDPERFKVGEKTVLSQPPGECPQKGDLNGDCHVDLIDFSILAYWYLKPNFPEKVDFNLDGKVDLVDFSILMFYWQG